MRSGHCAKTNKRRVDVQHPWSMRPPFLQSRRCRRQQMAGASFAPLHFPRTLLLPSALSFSLSFALLVALSRVKFTNPYGAPRASNERSSLSFSISFFLLIYIYIIFFFSTCICFCFLYFLFINYFSINLFPLYVYMYISKINYEYIVYRYLTHIIN